ncbi:MAG: hypothetical protein RLT05_27865 [Bauldia litoralis]
MAETATLEDLVDDICASGRIDAEDVLRLRRQVFPDGVVSEAEAIAVFRLDHACRDKDPAWTQFYVDALTDFFVWQTEPRGYVGADQANRLLKEISHDGRVDAMSELELLINVVHWCTQCPDSLAYLALAAVKDSVLNPATAPYGSNRPPAVVSPADVALIRKVIYAQGSPGGFTVTREEADLMVEIDQATHGEENADDWPDLFAKGVANALMFPRGAPVVPDAQEALRREDWLEDRRGVGRLLMEAGRSLVRGDVPVGEAYRAVDPFGAEARREADAREAFRVAEALHREAIDAAEARWLVDRLASYPALSEGAVRLLRFIRESSPSIDPALDPLFEKAGV